MKKEQPYLNYRGKSGLLCAIEKAGSQKKLAKLLGVAQPTISDWLALDDLQKKPINPNSGVAKAIAAAGNQTKLAKVLGTTQQVVNRWLTMGYTPPERAREIEMLYGIPRAQLLSPKLLSMIDAGSEL